MSLIVLTKVEAVRWLADGTLPADFAGRLRLLLEFTSCRNCDGRLCMGCAFREYGHTCADDCPDCCIDGQCVGVEHANQP